MVLKPVCKIVLVCMISFLLPNNVYVALQMLDQVGVIDMDSPQQITYVDIQLNEMVDCSLFSNEMDCSMVEACTWMGNHCMEAIDDCMDIDDEMMCSMLGCEWNMGQCIGNEEEQWGFNLLDVGSLSEQ